MEHNAHLHLQGNAYVTRPPVTADAGEDWLRRLVEKVDMNILMDSRAVFCEDLGNEGVTGMVGLTTSHASFHSWHMEDRPVVRFDLYSCRDFSPEQVFEMVAEWGATQIDFLFVDRADGFKILEAGTRHIKENIA